MNCPRCNTHVRVARFDGACPDCGADWLQPYAVRCLAEWSFVAYPHKSTTIPRGGPTQGYRTPGRRGPYIFAAKRALHQGRFASFSRRLVDAALTHDATLGLFVGPGPYEITDVRVFDPRRVDAEADVRRVDSKQERDVEILDIHAAEHGIGLGDYLAGRRALPEPAAAEAYPTSLRAFGVREVRE